MFTICTICWESLSAIPHESLYGGRIGAVSCGHVFHVNCINKWWNVLGRNHETLRSQRQPHQPIPTMIYRCPTCRQGGQHPHVFEVFFQDMEHGQEGRIVATAGPRKMFSICAICWDSLSAIPHESLYLGRIGAVSCGHVFHVNCINKWWNQQERNFELLRRQRQPGQPAPTLIYRCPVCRQGSQHPQVFELFFQDTGFEQDGRIFAAGGPRRPYQVQQQDRGELQGLVVAPNGVRLQQNGPREE